MLNNTNSPIEVLRSEKAQAIFRDNHIARAAVVGSFAREEARSDSDVDLLISYADESQNSLQKHFRMQENLAILVGRNIDLVHEPYIKPRLRPYIFAHQVEVYHAI